MKFQTTRAALQDIKADMLVLPFFKDEKIKGGPFERLDKAAGGRLSAALSPESFSGKSKDSFVIFAPAWAKAARVLLAGLGEEKKFDAEQLRIAAGCAGKAAAACGAKSVAFAVRKFNTVAPETWGKAFVEGLVLSAYKFVEHKTADKEKKKPEIVDVTFALADKTDGAAWAKGAEEGRIFAEAANFTRDLVNHPSNVVTPTMLANTAKKIAARYRMKCNVIDAAGARKLGMGAFLAVAKGSDEPAKFITIEYAPRGAKSTVALVGKGLTFDSGGLSLKNADGMENMKDDMGGAGAVLGCMMAAAQLKLDKRVIGIIAATENMPSGHATKPGDIVKSLGGKTIEIINTDAEGRLVLIDALKYAERYKPDAVIDMATLTGACLIALGPYYSALLGNNQTLMDSIKGAAEMSGDKIWQMPMNDDYREMMKSEVADLKNTSGTRSGGTITAAAFLSEFTENYAWAHIDIAPTAYITQPWAYIAKGATGVPVRAMLNFLKYYAPPKSGRART
jgi:leucyl aminopeptidase